MHLETTQLKLPQSTDRSRSGGQTWAATHQNSRDHARYMSAPPLAVSAPRTKRCNPRRGPPAASLPTRCAGASRCPPGGRPTPQASRSRPLQAVAAAIKAHLQRDGTRIVCVVQQHSWLPPAPAASPPPNGRLHPAQINDLYQAPSRRSDVRCSPNSHATYHLMAGQGRAAGAAATAGLAAALLLLVWPLAVPVAAWQPSNPRNSGITEGNDLLAV